MGVTEAYIGQQYRGGREVHNESAKNDRFEAAFALNELLCEQSAWAVEQKWGLPSTLTVQGKS